MLWHNLLSYPGIRFCTSTRILTNDSFHSLRELGSNGISYWSTDPEWQFSIISPSLCHLLFYSTGSPKPLEIFLVGQRRNLQKVLFPFCCWEHHVSRILLMQHSCPWSLTVDLSFCFPILLHIICCIIYRKIPMGWHKDTGRMMQIAKKSSCNSMAILGVFLSINSTLKREE